MCPLVARLHATTRIRPVKRESDKDRYPVLDQGDRRRGRQGDAGSSRSAPKFLRLASLVHARSEGELQRR